MRSALNRTPLHRYSPFYPAILLRTGYQNPPARSPDRPRYTVQRPHRICFSSPHPEKCRSARRHPAQGLPVPPPTAGNPPQQTQVCRRPGGILQFHSAIPAVIFQRRKALAKGVVYAALSGYAHAHPPGSVGRRAARQQQRRQHNSRQQHRNSFVFQCLHPAFSLPPQCSR